MRPTLRAMRLGAILVAAGLALAGCGGGDHRQAGSDTTTTAAQGSVTAELPPGAVGPTDTAEEQAEGPAATEASPESAPSGPVSKGELPADQQTATVGVVRDYITALDRHDARRVCRLFAPRGVDLSALPKRRDGCRPSLAASIGTRPPSGGPAWRRTALVEVKAEDLGDDGAREIATVTHRLSDRKYVSVEDDVIYLEKLGGRWLLAKPSATLYRAVGYAEPPLEAFAPPPAW